MDFGKALEALKNGAKITRKGWNGKNMYLWLKPSTVIKEEWCKDPVLADICHQNGGTVEALGTICMKTADNKVLTGWLASQTDMLSDDWDIYFSYNKASTNNYFEDLGWDIPEEDKVSPEEMNAILEDTRFNTAVGDVTHKLEGLNDNPAPAIDVLSEFKKSFKMGDEYETVPKRSDLQNFKAEVQNIGTQVLRMSNKDERLDFLKQAKEELLASADTDEKKAILEENFALFEDYINNN